MLTVLLGWTASTSLANTTFVIVENFEFLPASVSINVGDSVVWQWTSGCHSTTSSSGQWDSGVQCTPYYFTNTFTCAGVYPYYSSSPGDSFQGTVTVSPNGPTLSVCIATPTNNAIFASPWFGTLQSTAGGGAGTVTNVQYFRNSTLIGSARTSPYNLAVNNLGVGSYSFTALAADNLGNNSTSPVVAVTVIMPSAIVLSAPKRIAPGQFKFTYTANAGLGYAIQRASVLPNFTTITNATATASSVTFTDTAAGPGPNFYRVGRLPNP